MILIKGIWRKLYEFKKGVKGGIGGGCGGGGGCCLGGNGGNVDGGSGDGGSGGDVGKCVSKKFNGWYKEVSMNIHGSFKVVST